MTARRLVAIVGPTATGKSALAVELAKRLGGEIVNADSRQVYRGMDIGTAKPSLAERSEVRHHLFDVADPADGYSLALYLRDARRALEEIWGAGSFAWLVGGTGQYVWALLEAWTVPEVAPQEGMRREMQSFVEDKGASALHGRLQAVDPAAAARIEPNNVRRVIRALEVFEVTGRPISDWQQKGEPEFAYVLYGVDLPDEDLELRIDDRVEEIFAAGLVAEVEGLLDSGIPRGASSMSSIGYREVCAYLGGEMSLEEAKEATKRATRRLVRRQRQWFRKTDPRITWVASADQVEPTVRAFLIRDEHGNGKV
jgi:tRNA dimethylallyltransferase